MKSALLLGLSLLASASAPAPLRAQSPPPPPPPAFAVRPAAQVDSRGVFLSDVLLPAPAEATAPLPALKLAEAPLLGRSLALTRDQIRTALEQANASLVTSNWTGAARVVITRRTRVLEEAELKELLTATLQREHVGTRGDLDLRLVRPWTPAVVPDEPLTLRILDLPHSGVTASFITRFELRADQETVGAWQTMAQARLFRDVWVATGPLRRGTPLREADFTRERRDTLALRDPLTDFPADQAYLEVTESLPAGSVLCARSVQPRALVRRGGVVEALCSDGLLTISVKVEALESGALGQIVRVRNPQTRREFRGKVRDEQTILVSL